MIGENPSNASSCAVLAYYGGTDLFQVNDFRSFSGTIISDLFQVNDIQYIKIFDTR